MLACILLTLFFYYARPNFYRRHLELLVAEALGMEQSTWRGLLPYWYWSATSFTLRMLIPLGCIVFWFRESPRDYGFRLWEKGHGRFYLGLYLLLLPLLVLASFEPSFQAKYPFFKGAGTSWLHLLSY